MNKKVLIISSTPRKGGNSDILCDAFAEGAREAGNEIEKVRIADLKIGYCTGCYACNTYQFADYSRYDMTIFTEEEKRAHRDVQFPIDLANARALGKRLVEKALANALQAK